AAATQRLLDGLVLRRARTERRLRHNLGMSGDVDLALLAGSAVLLAAVAGVRLSSRLGVPSLLIYLALGMVLGEDVIGLTFDNTRLARDLGLVALALILAEGGLTTRWPDIRPGLPAAAFLATAG